MDGCSGLIMNGPNYEAAHLGDERWFDGALCVLCKYDQSLQQSGQESIKKGEPVVIYYNGSQCVFTNAPVDAYEGPQQRIGVVQVALDKTANDGQLVWVPVKGWVDSLRYYHATGTTDALGTYLRILIDTSVNAIGHTGNDKTERCADIESTPTTSTAASFAVLQEAVDTAVASGVVTKKAQLLGFAVDPAAQA